VENQIINTNGSDESKTKDIAALLKGETPEIEKQAVTGKRLLEIIFQPGCRPTLRWLQKQQQLRRIPFVKIGRRVWFFPDQVREAMIRQSTVTRRSA
jgi:hypothetical protein